MDLDFPMETKVYIVTTGGGGGNSREEYHKLHEEFMILWQAVLSITQSVL